MSQQFLRKAWMRECQSCFKQVITTKPDLSDPQEKWRDKKCPRCKSIDLDFGREVTVNAVNKIIEVEPLEDEE